MAGTDPGRTSQPGRLKASVIAEQVAEAVTGEPPRMADGVPAGSVLARPVVRRGLALLAVLALAVLTRRSRRPRPSRQCRLSRRR
ncbi:hypothetical protein SAVIM338S_07015 [Streptomyces avidinii]